MKQFTKWLCLIMVGILLIPTMVACTKEEPGEQPEQAVEITIAADRASDYILVYPANSTPSEISAYKEFGANLRASTMVFFDMKDDSEPAAEGAKEILLGSTNRTQSAEAYNQLGADQIGFYMIDGQLAIVSNFEDGFKTAGKEFQKRYVKDGAIKLMSDLSVRIQCEIGYDYVKVSNTQDIGGDDPYVIEHDGNYYYCWSNGGVMVAKIDGLDKIVKDNGVRVFDRAEGGFENVWAPELHYIDGEWYIYVAMCEGTADNAAHRMYCLKGTSQDPTDPFELVGKVTDPTDKWAIDGTVFKYNDELYTVWSGWAGNTDGQQNLYIAHMSNPWTIDSERVMISSPSLAYERYDTSPAAVNEGPAVLVNGDRIIVVYSCNGSWGDNYSLTAVYCDAENMMKSRGWQKLEKPLLTKGKQTYGPGHCSFSTAEDGSLWVIYHANLISGSGWGGRSVRIQPVEWKDGLPYIGTTKLTVNLPIRKLVVGEEIKD
jgi:GH43 family beta-xylosidase